MAPRWGQDLSGLRNDVENLKKHVFIGNGRPSLFTTVTENTVKIEEIEKDVKEIKDNQKEFQKSVERNHKQIVQGQKELMKEIAEQKKEWNLKFNKTETSNKDIIATLAKLIVISGMIIVGALIIIFLDAEILKNILKIVMSVI